MDRKEFQVASERKIINSVIKSLNILECFSYEVKELKLTEIANLLEVPKSTASNLVYTLVGTGYMKQNPDNLKYSLGPKVFTLGKIFEHHTNIAELSLPFMKILKDKFNETVHLSIPYGLSGLCIEKVESSNGIRMNSQVGKSLPLHCTASGKLFLSGMPKKELDEALESIELFKRTEYTITSIDRLHQEVQNIKRNGFSVANEEGELGLISIAAPVYDKNNSIAASLSIAGPTARIAEDLRDKIIKELIETSKLISLKYNYGIS